MGLYLIISGLLFFPDMVKGYEFTNAMLNHFATRKKDYCAFFNVKLSLLFEIASLIYFQ